ncbi:hypothetical protein [Phytoactinopolyspora halotolerans]|uniref:Uncharacterized protein n=1 Tax=Phytoactinopolyspora halotolerans TaxID=1981512 RepID=A0A6L9S6F2_9ACTN|nr:hypothetical protein [Phytoactinopolyspora halotolerans]NEE00122.1 hypothetical protein [Phytoactinopolyspora halotolerans]
MDLAREPREPFMLDQGHVAVPTGLGLGVSPIPDILRELTTSTVWISADALR